MKLASIFLSLLLFLLLLIPKFAEGKIFNKDLVSKVVLSTGYKTIICPVDLEDELTFFEKSEEFSCIGPEEELLFGEVILSLKPNEGQQPIEGTELILIYKEDVLRLDSISFDYYEKGQDEPLESKTPGRIYPGLKYLKATTIHKVDPALSLGQETVPETAAAIFYHPNGKMGGILFTYQGKVYKLLNIEKEVTDIVLVDYSQSAPTSPTPNETTNWKTYTDSIHKFSVKYPSQATVEEKTEQDLKNGFGNPIKKVQFDIDRGKETFYFYWVTVYPAQNEQSVENWIKKYEANGDAIKLVDTTLFGLPAKNAVSGIPGGIYERQGIYILKGNYIYSMIISAPNINDQIKNEFTNLLSTFSFD